MKVGYYDYGTIQFFYQWDIQASLKFVVSSKHLLVFVIYVVFRGFIYMSYPTFSQSYFDGQFILSYSDTVPWPAAQLLTST